MAHPVIYGTIDIGNTFAKLAVFHVSKNGKKFRFKDEQKLKDLDVGFLKKWIEDNSIQSMAYCASGSDNKEVLDFLHKRNHSYLLSHESKMPISIEYKTPATLGRDRIAAVLGAYYLYPNKNVLIVDAGTCITYEWLTAEGKYLGGNIAPGLRMRLTAMHDYTAKLPLVPLEGKPTLIGQSTASALFNGAVMGTICEIETFIGRTKKELGNSYRVVLTGGDATYLKEELKVKNKIHTDLVHLGLCELIRYNDENNDK